MTTPEPKRRGRPPKSADDRKGSNLTFRTRADFRARLEEAAEKSGRSVTEEVELRVERSFEADDKARRLDDILSVFFDHGPHALAFVKDIMVVASLLQEHTQDGRRIGSEDWPNSAPTRAGIDAGVKVLLKHYAGVADETGPDIDRMRAVGTLHARITTGQADDIIALALRQDDAQHKDQ